MKYSHLFGVALLILALSAVCAWRVRKDALARQHARILYIEDGSEWNLLVNGDGRLTVQKHEASTTATWPTCTATVARSDVEALLHLMAKKHFETLPQKGFPLYVGAIGDFPWKLHIIVLEAGSTRGQWVFETGQMNGRVESIPPDFAAVESYLRELRRRATPADGASCPLAPDIAIWSTGSAPTAKEPSHS